MAWLSWKRLRRWQRLALALPVLVLAIWACALAYLYAREAWEPSKLAYQSHCAGCHGRALEGTDSAPTLLGRELTLTNDYDSLMAAMAGGDGAPPFHDWRTELPPPMMKAVALYINERQQAYRSTTESYGFGPQPEALVELPAAMA